MEKKIFLLDYSTTNQIAAGEVVEKPASVVKELVENALDAESTNIDIEIADGGIGYIRVTDNGFGMNEEDAKMSLLRHATSKIRTNDDLLYVRTLGFRGEALPSIASVSKFSLITRIPEVDLATKVSLLGGEQEEVMQTGGYVGTSVIVEDLFFNVPARRKFLRKENTEGRYINEIVGKLALTRPDVKFVLTNNGRQVLNTPGNNDLADTIAGIYGAKVKEELLKVDYQSENIRIDGFVGKPSLLKSSKQWQTLIVNGRVINSRFISRALDHAYQSQLPKSGYPFAVINITIDTTQIDVNVHPQKSEIRFSDEQTIYRAIYKAVSDSLTTPLHQNQPKQFTQENNSYENNLGANVLQNIKEPVSYSMEQIYKQPQLIRENVIGYAHNSTSDDFVAARETIMQDNVFSEPRENLSSPVGIDVIWPLGQIDRMYIVAQSDDCLYLIDQHAAHERIMYDILSANKKDIPIQQLLVPLYVELSTDDVDLALDYKDVFANLCFEIEAAGPDVLRINAMPADIDSEDLASFIQKALQLIVEMKQPDAKELRHELIAMTSCKAAIKAGQTLNIREMRELINRLMNTEHPFTCPHGRPVIITFSSSELFKMFKRT